MGINTNDVNRFQRKDLSQTFMVVQIASNGSTAGSFVNWSRHEEIDEIIPSAKSFFKWHPAVQYLVDLFSESKPVQIKQVAVIVMEKPKTITVQPGECAVLRAPGVDVMFGLEEEDIQLAKLHKTADCIRSYVENNSEINVLEKCLDSVGMKRVEISE